MADTNNVQGVMTEQQFNSSPLKTLMSYKDYFMRALKLGSAFTFQKAMVMQNAEETSDRIKASVKGWALEKEQKKEEAEEKYYAALAQYEAMKKQNASALKDLKYTTNTYGESSYWYSDALKKYNLSNKTLFDADISLSCARDQFNFANISAFKAFLTSQG